MRKFIVRIAYQYYSIDQHDAIELLAIASRMQLVKQPDFQGPYYVQPDQEPWLDTISIQEVLDKEEPSENLDKLSAATRDVAPL